MSAGFHRLGLLSPFRHEERKEGRKTHWVKVPRPEKDVLHGVGVFYALNPELEQHRRAGFSSTSAPPRRQGTPVDP